jgi:hypothetical protein
VRFRFLLLTQHGGLANIKPDDPSNPVDALQRMIADAIAGGELRQRNAALLAAMIVGVVVQTATFVLYGRVQASMSDLADELVVACRGLAE